MNIPKRIFGYLIDSVLIGLLTFGFTAATHSAVASAIFNAALFLLRDAALPGGSPGKHLSGLRMESSNRFLASFLRNIPFAVPAMVFGFVPPGQREQLVFSLVMFAVAIAEIWRMHSTGGARFGDQLARDRIVDLRPQESRKRYVFYILALLACTMLLQVVMDSFLMRGEP